jgi:uncharacterized protein (TIGR02597 family)
MHINFLTRWAAVFLASVVVVAQAQEVASGIFGYANLTMLGNSDTVVSLPFSRLATASETVASVAGSVVTVQTTSNWTVNQFVYASGTQSNTYFLRFDSGAMEGRYFDVTANGTNSVTVNLGTDSLATVVATDKISIVPHWTFGVVFANGNGIHPSTSTLTHKTEVLIPGLTNSGINLGVGSVYYYYSNSPTTVAWRNTASSSTNVNDDIIQPNAYLVIRHKIATNTTFTSFGDVLLTKVRIPIRTSTTVKQDNAVGLIRPLPVALTNAGLFESGAFVPSTSSLTHKDELLAFDNTTTNQNKGVALVYYYYNSAWRRSDLASSVDVGGSNVFQLGNGYIIRKAISSTNSPAWLNSPTY